MSGRAAASGAPANPRRLAAAGLAAVAIWAFGATVARWTGIWTGVGGAALLAGGLVLGLGAVPLRPPLRPSLRQLGIGVAAGAAMIAATHLLYPPATRLVPAIAGETAALYKSFAAIGGPAIWVALPLVVLAEELIWRGVVQEALVHRCGRLGVLLASLVYALAHAPFGSPLLVAVALACGLAWGALRLAAGSLFAVLVTHLMWDLAIFLWWPLVS